MKKLAEVIYDKFQQLYSKEPIMVRSPGRVNLIGDHTDYNQGLVLPAAINKSIILAIAPNDLQKVRAFALDMDNSTFEADIQDEIAPGDQEWPNFLLGILYVLKKSKYEVSGFDCVFGSTIPIGAGLSSSAALEGAFVVGLDKMWDLGLKKIEMAKLGQQVEHQFIGVRCGIMDQYANLHGLKRHLIRLDCRTLEHRLIPFNNRNIRILLCDTNVHRELTGSEYNNRRQQCEEGVSFFARNNPAIQSLRDITFEMLEKGKKELDSTVYNRCRYVLEENRRVELACDHLRNGDLESFGARMYESHYGLRDLFEVSCLELDLLVEKAESLDGVIGARMMGGGFGGCTINLVWNDQLEEVTEQLMAHYKKKRNIIPNGYVVNTDDGTDLLSVKNTIQYE
jgi:galactokinase